MENKLTEEETQKIDEKAQVRLVQLAQELLQIMPKGSHVRIRLPKPSRVMVPGDAEATADVLHISRPIFNGELEVQLRPQPMTREEVLALEGKAKR